MHSILHINNVTEQFAQAYNLQVTHSIEEANILILRDPMDRMLEQVTDYLENNGNKERLTFEQHVMKEKNTYCNLLNINKHTDVRQRLEVEKTFDFIHLTSNAIWSESSVSLYPNTTIELNPFYSLDKTNKDLAKFLGQTKVDIQDNSYYQSNKVDVGFRADFQQNNSLDYYLIRKIKQFLEFGDFDDSLD